VKNVPPAEKSPVERCTEPLLDELTHNKKQQKVRIVNMMETEQQGTTEMLDESQVQVHVNKDRGSIWRLKGTWGQPK
jgi:hypothetical protein